MIADVACRCGLSLALLAFLACEDDRLSRSTESPDRVTFSRDVAPILFEHCSPCHRPGQSAPFSLLDYASARSRARQIHVVTSRRYMPPWLPAPGPVAFAGEARRRLDDAQIDTLRRWFEDGAPEGDPRELPPLPAFPAEWQLGAPDIVLDQPEPFRLAPDARDVYRNFVFPADLADAVWVRGVEVRPGNPKVAHHGVLMVDQTWESSELARADPLPGFDGMLPARAARIPDGHLIGWLPGTTPRLAPAGMAWRLHPGADVVLQLHMLPSGRDEVVRPKIGLHLTEHPPTRTPFVFRMGSKALDIPAGARRHVVRDRYALPVDVDLLTVYPHAHTVARSITAHAVFADGRRMTLLDIPAWDPDWQDQYTYERPISLPRGTVLEAEFVYDNSPDNPRNPNQPPRRVTYGPDATDEMADLSIQLVPRNPEGLALLESDFAVKDWLDWIESHRLAIRLAPNDPQPHAELGAALLELQRDDEAERSLLRALELDPANANAHYYLGALSALRQRPAEAMAHFRQALEARPTFVDAMTNLAAVHWGRGELDRSEALYRRAIAIRPYEVEARLFLGRLLAARGDHPEAAEHLQAAASQQPDDPRIRFELCLSLSASGHRVESEREARRALRDALALGDRPLAVELRRRLEAQRQGLPLHSAAR